MVIDPRRTTGKNTDAIALAQKIETAQNREIATMHRHGGRPRHQPLMNPPDLAVPRLAEDTSRTGSLVVAKSNEMIASDITPRPRASG